MLDVFFVTCKHINNYKRQGELYFGYHKTITDVNTTMSHFAFKTEGLRIQMMRSACKTDLASLKCDEISFKCLDSSHKKHRANTGAYHPSWLGDIRRNPSAVLSYYSKFS